MKRLAACVLALTVLVTFLGCHASDTFSNVERVPSPLPSYYGGTARNPWNMIVYSGTLYIAGGDYSANSGAAPIFAYDPSSSTWREAHLTADESVSTFRVFDNTLYVAGNDSVNADRRGNYYTLQNGVWETHAILPDAAHLFDLTMHEGAFFYGIGTFDGAHSPVLCQSGNGFYEIPFFKNGESVTNRYDFTRAYNFFTTPNGLFAFFCGSRGEENDCEFYRFDGEAFQYVSDFKDLSVTFYKTNGKRLWQNAIVYEFNLNSEAYFTTGHLYKTADFQNIERVQAPDGAIVSDLLLQDGVRYVLGFSQTEAGTCQNYIWRLDDDGGFKTLASFSTEGGYALSFEMLNGEFYVGLGSRDDGALAGTVLKILR